jgi:hypothetical protein
MNARQDAIKNPIKPCSRCDKAYSVKSLLYAHVYAFDQEKQKWVHVYAVASEGSGEFDQIPLLGILEKHLQKFSEHLEDQPSFNLPEELVALAVLTPETQLRIVAPTQAPPVETQPEIPADPGPASDEPQPALAE